MRPDRKTRLFMKKDAEAPEHFTRIMMLNPGTPRGSSAKTIDTPRKHRLKD